MSQQPAGWYDDPSNPDNLRYWDGVTWSDHTAPRKSPTASSSSGGPDYQGQRPTAPTGHRQQSQPTQASPPLPPMPQGSGWQDQPQHPQQGWQGQQGQFGQAPQYPGSPGSPGAANWMHSIKTTADGVPLASWGRRLGAWLIDGVILFVLITIVSRIVAPDLWAEFGRAMNLIAEGSQASADQASRDLTDAVAADSVKLAVAQFLIISLYCIGFWTTTAQTPGKMAVGISVRRVDRPGPLDVMTAARRRLLSVVQLIPGISFLWPLLDLLDGLWPLWDDKRQTLHDKIAQTQVVMGKQPKGDANPYG
ncbi:MAG: RDD family protein [Humibacillus sp.]|nr:RDD family protein [Humibacillus sp.]MDN5778885.1 RDD family protein [Humibacillus sp.]